MNCIHVHWIVHFKQVNDMVCGVYLSKAAKKSQCRGLYPPWGGEWEHTKLYKQLKKKSHKKNHTYSLS